MLVLAAAAFTVGIVVLSAHEADVERRRALANEQRGLAAALGEAAHDFARDGVADPERIRTLRARSLEMLVRTPVDTRSELAAQWKRIVAGLDVLGSAGESIAALSTALEDVRIRARVLLVRSVPVAGLLASGAASPAAQGMGELVGMAPEQLALELERMGPFDGESRERAQLLLDLLRRALAFLRSDATVLAADPSIRQALAGLAAQLEACEDGLGAVRTAAAGLDHLPDALGALNRSEEAVQRFVSDFEAGAKLPLAAFGASVRAWLYVTGLLALLALFAVGWRRGRYLRARAAEFESAWRDSTEATSYLRRLLHSFLRAVDVQGDRLAGTEASRVPGQELEDMVHETVGILPRIIAHRSRRAIVLSSIRESLQRHLGFARDCLIAHSSDGDGGGPALAPIREIETMLRNVGLHGGAALAAEIRMTAEDGLSANGAAAGAPEDPDRVAHDPSLVHHVLAGGFTELERCIDRAIEGERENVASIVFLINDLRAVGRTARLPVLPGFNPDLPRAGDTPRSRAPELRSEASRLLPGLREGLDHWQLQEGTTEELHVLRRGARRLAEAAGYRFSNWRRFWSTAAAFCVALGDGAIPFGPAVRHIVSGLVREATRLAQEKDAAAPSPALFRELLLYVALAETRHAELEAVRTDFDLYREPLMFPETADAAAGTDGSVEANVSGEIIQQLEHLRATIDRINLAPEPGNTG